MTIELFLVADILPNLLLFKAHRGDSIPACPELLAVEVALPPAELPSHRDRGSFALRGLETFKLAEGVVPTPFDTFFVARQLEQRIVPARSTDESDRQRLSITKGLSFFDLPHRRGVSDASVISMVPSDLTWVNVSATRRAWRTSWSTIS